MKLKSLGFLAYLVTLVVFLAMFSSCEVANDVRTIKLGHGLDITHPVHKAMVFMAQRLEEKSNGTMLLDIYPSQ